MEMFNGSEQRCVSCSFDEKSKTREKEKIYLRMENEFRNL